jgi:hypothetical protein
LGLSAIHPEEMKEDRYQHRILAALVMPVVDEELDRIERRLTREDGVCVVWHGIAPASCLLVSFFFFCFFF